MKTFLFLFFAIIVQSAFLEYASVWGASVNIVVVLIALLGFSSGNYRNMIVPVFCAGIVLDVMGGLPFGIVLLTLLTAVIVLDMSAAFIPHQGIHHFIIFAVVATISYDISMIALLRLAGVAGLSDTLPVFPISLFGITLEIVFQSIAALFVYPLRAWITS